MRNDTLTELAAQVRDCSKPVEERRNALRMIAKMKGDPHAANGIPEEQLGAVASAVAHSYSVLPNGLPFKDCAEAVSQGFAARGTGLQRR